VKRILYAAISIVMPVLLSGCIQDTIVIHVRPNGSGTIEETCLLSNTMFDLVGSIAGSVADSGKGAGVQDNGDATKKSSIRDAEQTREDIIAKMIKDAEKRAETFGSTVKFMSAKSVKTDIASGYNAVYAFQYIGQIRVNQNLGARMEGKVADKSDSPREENLLFKFTKGPPSKLVIILPQEKEIGDDRSGAQDTGKDVGGKSNQGTSDQTPVMVKNIFQDIKVKIALQFEGTILKTNATYRDDSTVTLIEIDGGKIIGNGVLFKRMLSINPQSVGDTKALLKDVEGLKFETSNPVYVEFE